MHDREKVKKALEHCKDNQHVNDCNECYYGGKTGMFCIRMIDDAIALLEKQEEREKAICKEICNFIRGACSTDTDDDKDFVCYEIQKMFVRD